MNCRRARHILMQEAAGALDEKRSRALRGHLERCPACAAELEDLREAGRIFGRARAPLADPSPAVWESVRERIQASTGRKNVPARRPLMWGVATSFAAAALAIAGYFTLGTFTPQGGLDSPPAALQSIAPQEAPPPHVREPQPPAQSAEGSPVTAAEKSSLAQAKVPAAPLPVARRSSATPPSRPHRPAASRPAPEAPPAAVVAWSLPAAPVTEEGRGGYADTEAAGTTRDFHLRSRAVSDHEKRSEGLLLAEPPGEGPAAAWAGGGEMSAAVAPAPDELEESARALEMVYTSPDGRARTILDY